MFFSLINRRISNIKASLVYSQLMAVLTKSKILGLLRSGKLKIMPFDEKQVGAGSIDLHLGNTFRVFRDLHTIFSINDEADYRKITRVIKVLDGRKLIISSGQLIHGITVENISLPKGISGRIEGRSRFARVGLLTHLSSGFVQPATHGKIVLEIANLSPLRLAIYPGTTICQLILEETKGNGEYSGRFYEQNEP